MPREGSVGATLNQQSFSVDIGAHDLYSNGWSRYGKGAVDSGRGGMGKWRVGNRKSPGWWVGGGKKAFCLTKPPARREGLNASKKWGGTVVVLKNPGPQSP